jgi:hypothetical protein
LGVRKLGPQQHRNYRCNVPGVYCGIECLEEFEVRKSLVDIHTGDVVSVSVPEYLAGCRQYSQLPLARRGS